MGSPVERIKGMFEIFPKRIPSDFCGIATIREMPRAEKFLFPRSFQANESVYQLVIADTNRQCHIPLVIDRQGEPEKAAIIDQLQESISSGAAVYVEGERPVEFCIGKGLSFFEGQGISFADSVIYKGIISIDGIQTYQFDINAAAPSSEHVLCKVQQH